MQLNISYGKSSSGIVVKELMGEFKFQSHNNLPFQTDNPGEDIISLIRSIMV